MKKVYQKTIEFYDKNVQEYLKNTIGLQDADWLRKFCELLPNRGIVLDAGCGFGRDCEYFVDRGFDIYGIDLSKNMIDYAKKFAPEAKYSVMDMMDLKFENNYFDGIWCSATLLHLSKKDVPLALAEFRRVLKQNGILFLDIKEGTGEKVIKDQRYHDQEKFYSYFQKDEIKKILEDQNFSLIEYQETFRKENYTKGSKLSYLLAKKAK